MNLAALQETDLKNPKSQIEIFAELDGYVSELGASYLADPVRLFEFLNTLEANENIGLLNYFRNASNSQGELVFVSKQTASERHEISELLFNELNRLYQKLIVIEDKSSLTYANAIKDIKSYAFQNLRFSHHYFLTQRFFDGVSDDDNLMNMLQTLKSFSEDFYLANMGLVKGAINERKKSLGHTDRRILEEEYDSVLNAAYLAVVDAIFNFETGKVQFSTYLYQTIMRRIRAFFIQSHEDYSQTSYLEEIQIEEPAFQFVDDEFTHGFEAGLQQAANSDLTLDELIMDLTKLVSTSIDSDDAELASQLVLSIFGLKLVSEIDLKGMYSSKFLYAQRQKALSAIRFYFERK